MGINWGLADPSRNQFDYLESLQALGQVRVRDMQNQSDAMRLADIGMRRQARPGIQAQAEAGDFDGARSAAMATGDFDMARAIGDLSDDHRKRLENEGVIIGRAAGALKRVPVEQRAQVFAGMRPRLRQHGISDDELAGVTDLSDAALDQFVALSQSINDGLTGQLTQRRIDDIGEDNERGDMLAENTLRATSDMIADRTARRALTARGQNMADARGRYATDVASRDRVRGQDLSHADRVRSIQARGSGGGRRAPRGAPGASADNPVPVTSRSQATALPKGTFIRTPDGRTMRVP